MLLRSSDLKENSFLIPSTDALAMCHAEIRGPCCIPCCMPFSSTIIAANMAHTSATNKCDGWRFLLLAQFDARTRAGSGTVLCRLCRIHYYCFYPDSFSTTTAPFLELSFFCSASLVAGGSGECCWVSSTRQ
jgi:hypothetical protein